jgi:hypothetical protein
MHAERGLGKFITSKEFKLRLEKLTYPPAYTDP